MAPELLNQQLVSPTGLFLNLERLMETQNFFIKSTKLGHKHTLIVINECTTHITTLSRNTYCTEREQNNQTTQIHRSFTIHRGNLGYIKLTILLKNYSLNLMPFKYTYIQYILSVLIQLCYGNFDCKTKLSSQSQGFIIVIFYLCFALYTHSNHLCPFEQTGFVLGSLK